MPIFALYTPCSDLTTRALKWVITAEQTRNGSRPSPYIHWGVSTEAIVETAASVAGY
jgi:hypothetical protein